MPSCILALPAIFGLACAAPATKTAGHNDLIIESFKPYTLFPAVAYCQPSLCPGHAEVCACRPREIGADLHHGPLKISAPVIPPFNLTLLVVMGQISSSVRDFCVSKLPFDILCANMGMDQGMLGGILS
jgi:hypothetical protein